MRLRIDLAYDGTDFAGWARQPGRRTVEDELSAGMTKILRSPAPVRLVVAGRTDAGVHARGQVVHADVDPAAWAALPGRAGERDPAGSAVARLAGVLPRDIVVRRVGPAPAGFDARFSATQRRYEYRLLDDPTALDPLRRHDTVVVRQVLDVGLLDAAARSLEGLRDFAALCKLRPGATTIRTLLEFRWQRLEGVLVATVVADAFCHSMVRALVGVVVPVGRRERPASWPAGVVAAGGRHPHVKVMPPHGLSLMEVSYPPDGQLAAQAATARSLRVLPIDYSGGSAAQPRGLAG